MKLIRKVQNPEALESHILGLLPKFELDKSKYAPGRYHLWAFAEPHLVAKKVFSAYSDNRLKSFAQNIYPGEVNAALLTYNGQIDQSKFSRGEIQPHRDANYALPDAILINIGEAKFHYCSSRQGNSCDRHIDLISGGIYHFNCKHLHSVSNLSPGRISIVL